MKKWFLFCFLSISQLVFAKEGNLRIISYGSAGTSRSVELVILIDNLIAKENSPLKLIKQENGVAFRKGDTYLLTGENKEFDFIEATWETPQKSQKSFHYFESARSFLAVPQSAPKKFVELIQKQKNGFSKYGDWLRYWSDLKYKKGLGGEIESSKFSFFKVPRKEWNKDKNWHLSYFIRYELEFDGQKTQVIALPKVFGGVTRHKNTISKLKSSNSIILSAGGLVPLEGSQTSYAMKEMGEIGKQYVAAHFYEIASKRSYIDKYKSRWGGNPPFEFLSANTYIKDGDSEKLLFEPYKIIEKGGLKIAIIGITGTDMNASLAKNSVARPWLAKVHIKDIWQILSKKIIPQIKNKVDLTVLLGYLSEEEYGRLERQMRNIDLVVRHRPRILSHPATSSAKIEDFAERYPQYPIVHIPARNHSIAYTDISIKNKNFASRTNEIVLDHNVIRDRSDDEANLKYNKSNSFFSPNKPILPDPRKIYPGETGHIAVSKVEFANAAAFAMRHYTKSEIGIFSIQTQHSDIPGQVDSSILKSWIRPEEELVVLYLTGGELIKLLETAKTAESPHKIAISGLSPDGEINGAAINLSENYRIITSTSVTEDSVAYPMLKDSPRKYLKFIKQGNYTVPHRGGSRINLTEFISEVLTRKWKHLSEKKNEKKKLLYYKNLFEGVTPPPKGYWLLDFKSIRLQYSRLTTTDTTPFAAVSDSRLATADQENIGGEVDFSAYYRKNPYISEFGIRSSFSKIEVQQNDGSSLENILSDDLVFFANIGFPWIKLKNWRKFATQAGPFFEIAYDTEFDKGAANEKEKNILGTVGWRFYDGQIIKDLTIGFLNETRLSNELDKNEWGATTRLRSEIPLLNGHALFKTEIIGQYFFDSSRDDDSDLKHRLIVDSFIDMKVFGKFYFGPYFKYFNFSAKTSDAEGTQTEIGVSFNFSSIWKPKFENSMF